MESAYKTNNSGDSGGIITLKGYYKSLPEPTYPKKVFVSEVARRCNVSEATVKNWIMYGFRPDNPEHVKILSEVSGIPEENLWRD